VATVKNVDSGHVWGDGIWFSHIITSALYHVILDCRPIQSIEIWTRPSSPMKTLDWVMAVHQKEWTGLDHSRPSSPSGSPPRPVSTEADNNHYDRLSIWQRPTIDFVFHHTKPPPQ
jgi:hypothetical protein